MDWEKRSEEIAARIAETSLNEVIAETGRIWCYYRSMYEAGATAIPMPFDITETYTHAQARIIAEVGTTQFEQLMEKAWSDYKCQQ